ncbi:MAG: YCF48-related protein [Bacteroidota bacterium]
MKLPPLTFISVILVLFLPVTALSQVSGWQWRNPAPQGNDLYKVIFTDSLTGFAVGGYGTMLNTLDGGRTWDQLPGITGDTLSSIAALANGTLFALGLQGKLLKSVDHGSSWKKINTVPGLDSLSFYDISFFKNDTGYIVGDGHLVLKTTDGGDSWQLIHREKGAFPYSTIASISPAAAIATGPEFGLSKTTDGGITWKYIGPGTPSHVFSAFFTSVDTGYCSGIISDSLGGHNGFICKTTNGGSSWNRLAVDTSKEYNYLYFTTPSEGFVLGDGHLYKTINGGQSWMPTGNMDLTGVWSLCFPTATAGCGVGALGKVCMTHDGGITWDDLRKGFRDDINYITFPGADTGFIACNTRVMKTNDGGNNWFTVDSLSGSWVRRIAFGSPEAGMIIKSDNAYNYYISSTRDGGKSWHDSLFNGKSLLDLNFPSANTAYVLYLSTGEVGVLMTKDGGLNWSTTVFSGFSPSYLYFINRDTGFVRGVAWNNSVLYKTKNGGLTWEQKTLPYPVGSDFYTGGKIFFTGNETGYMLGTSVDTVTKKYFPLLLKTTDAGESWHYLPRSPQLADCELRDAFFLKADTGFVTGVHWIYINNGASSEGTILETCDGGKNWEFQIHKTSNNLNGITFINNSTGFAVGAGGTILGTSTRGDLPSGIPAIIVNAGRSLRVFPNPATGLVTFSMNFSETGPFYIRFFDIHGKLARTNIHGFKANRQDYFSCPVAGLEPGLYVYTLHIGNLLYTGKLLKQ